MCYFFGFLCLEGVKPTEATYLALMEVCRHSRDSKAAVEVFEAMETEGVRPGVKSYISLLKARFLQAFHYASQITHSYGNPGGVVAPPPTPCSHPFDSHFFGRFDICDKNWFRFLIRNQFGNTSLS